MIDSSGLEFNNVFVDQSAIMNETDGLVELHKSVEKPSGICYRTNLHWNFLSFGQSQSCCRKLAVIIFLYVLSCGRACGP